jgi:hypothetical protein
MTKYIPRLVKSLVKKSAVVLAATAIMGTTALGCLPPMETTPTSTPTTTPISQSSNVYLNRDEISCDGGNVVITGEIRDAGYVPWTILKVELKYKCNSLSKNEIDKYIKSTTDMFPAILSTYWLDKKCDDNKECPYTFYGRIAPGISNLEQLIQLGEALNQDVCK